MIGPGFAHSVGVGGLYFFVGWVREGAHDEDELAVQEVDFWGV